MVFRFAVSTKWAAVRLTTLRFETIELLFVYEAGGVSDTEIDKTER